MGPIRSFFSFSLLLAAAVPIAGRAHHHARVLFLVVVPLIPRLARLQILAELDRLLVVVGDLVGSVGK